MQRQHGLDDDDGQAVGVQQIGCLQPLVEAVLLVVRAEVVVIRLAQTEKIPEESHVVESLDRQGQDAADQRQVVAMRIRVFTLKPAIRQHEEEFGVDHRLRPDVDLLQCSFGGPEGFSRKFLPTLNPATLVVPGRTAAENKVRSHAKSCSPALPRRPPPPGCTAVQHPGPPSSHPVAAHAGGRGDPRHRAATAATRCQIQLSLPPSPRPSIRLSTWT